MHLVASPDYVEHDAFVIFQKLMIVTKSWFESNQRQGEAELARPDSKIDESGLFGKKPTEDVRSLSQLRIFRIESKHEDLST